MFLLSGILIFSSSNATADTFAHTVSAALSSTTYSGSTLRQQLTDYSVSIHTAFREKVGILAGYKQTLLNARSEPQQSQTQVLLGAEHYHYADTIQSRIGYHAQLYTLSLKQQRANITPVYTGGLSALDFRQRYYFDLYYALSDYTHSQSVSDHAHQLSSAIEFKPFIQASWLSLQFFSIWSNNPTRVAGTLGALRTEWTQYTYASGRLLPTSIALGTQFGTQRFQVLHRIATIDNSGNTVNQSWWMEPRWQLNDITRIGVNLAWSDYSDDQNNYFNALSTSVYLNARW